MTITAATRKLHKVFFTQVMNKPAYPITDQIALLKQRGMIFKDEDLARRRLNNISYYRLKGYWWEDQYDHTLHLFQKNTCFENILERYDFDRQLRVILFAAIEQIEIGFRSKLIHHLSLGYGGLWYENSALFVSANKTKKGITKTVHAHILDDLRQEFDRSQEPFIQDHHGRYPLQSADAWKILEVASMGLISRLYKNLNRNLPERGLIAGEMGVNSPAVFSGWLEAVSAIRNVIAHHSRLWSRMVVIRPKMILKNPCEPWFDHPLKKGQLDKPFAVISCMVYLCKHLEESNAVKHQILSLIRDHPGIPIYKYGFFNDWESEPLWS
jgi:abortive infection bacteriophage resistance protein